MVFDKISSDMTYRFEQILSTYTQTHMPYIADTSIGTVFAFCIPVNTVWKIHYSVNAGPVTRLVTETLDNDVECSPVVYETADGVFISFISGDSKTWASLSLKVAKLGARGSTELIHDARTGYTRGPSDTVHAESDSVIHMSGSEPAWFRIPGRIACIRPSSEGLLLSYRTNEERDRDTILLDIRGRSVTKLRTAQDAPIYKPCIYEGVLLNVMKTGYTDIDRRIEVCRRVNKYEESYEDFIGGLADYEQYRKERRQQYFAQQGYNIQ